MDITRWMSEQEQDLLCHLEDEFMSEREIQPGDTIWWLDKWCVSGYTPPVRAIFIKRYRSRVGIAVEMRNGTWQPKKVTMNYIREREV